MVIDLDAEREAGRLPSMQELDAAVARIMGIEWNRGLCRICGFPLGEEGTRGECVLGVCTTTSCSFRPRPERRADSSANYAEDLAASLELRLWLRRQGKVLTRYCAPSGCAVSFDLVQVNHKELEDEPLALALATVSLFERKV